MVALEATEVDIYQGDQVPNIVVRPPTPAPTVSSVASTSILRRPTLGAIAALVESAVLRWASSNRWSASSISSASSVSSSSTISLEPRTPRIRSRRSQSVATSISSHIDINIAARIDLRKAREKARQVPRCFILYLPTWLRPLHSEELESEELGLFQSIVLQPVLRQLEAGLRKVASGKGTRARHHSTPDDSSRRSRRPEAWFLDIACPTWKDMRELGKVLHLHPLTLDHILRRDRAEKLEHFPKLGYYFVSFRAIERQKDGDPPRILGDGLDDGRMGVNASNVYLVVFEDGICAFHYADMSEHLDNVRRRVVSLNSTVRMSSDRITHILLDSVLDAFSSMLKELEMEVIDLEDMVLIDKIPATPVASPVTSSRSPHAHAATSAINEKRSVIKWDESIPARRSVVKATPQFGPFFTSLLSPSRRLKQIVSGWFWIHFSTWWEKDERYRPLIARPRDKIILQRSARARRLVTSLIRLLATKPGVIAQVRKRIMPSRKWITNAPSSENADVALHMGNIQDYIRHLQHSLDNCDHLLGESHLSYLSQLDAAHIVVKNRQDLFVLRISAALWGDTCCQVLCGILSLNVTVPQNSQAPDGKLVWFGIVLGLCGLIISAYLNTVLYWWKQAQKLHSHSKAL